VNTPRRPIWDDERTEEEPFGGYDALVAANRNYWLRQLLPIATRTGLYADEIEKKAFGFYSPHTPKFNTVAQ